MPDQGELAPVQHRVRRRSDPSPSADAARDHVASGANANQTQLVYELLISAERTHGRAVTASELEQEAQRPEWYGPKWQSYLILKRLNDLRVEGKVENGPQVRCPVTKRNKTTWRTVRQTKLSLIASVSGPKGRLTRRNLERCLDVALRTLESIARNDLVDSWAEARDAVKVINNIKAGTQ